MAPLLDQKPNVGVASVAAQGSNATINIQLSFRSWNPWSEFKFENLTRMLEKDLSQEYQSSRESTPLDQDLNSPVVHSQTHVSLLQVASLNLLCITEYIST